ncbi:hypothetical protein RFI_15137 [Reticulomyxa filosa]|uniref:Uncharacterized protein n=1 Tax=Reticulomyxa filosa TaxID=46433 RepID=X6N8J3_RETFI|nr:hypothetical protein RFI_15137 [Reticulomyxa filosa]|eukprot:ETO22064.1 hypothetical protein RFI_15137 [Reticulomyxa filosa]
MSQNVFVTIGSKKYRLKLATLTVDCLKKQIIEESKFDERANMLIKITDGDGCDIEKDKHLQLAIEDGQTHFTAHFQPDDTAQKKRASSYEVKNPLVLLAGAIKYEQQSYLEDAKQDLCLLQTLFQTKFGYNVFNTLNSQNPTSESLTLNDLNNFILKHCLNLRDDCSNNKNAYDGLIFVWCGYGSNEDNLITSDMKTKPLKHIQDDFAIRTDYFMGKPKIFMKIIYGEQEKASQMKIKRVNENNQKRLWYNHDADIFTIFANNPRNSITEAAGNGNKKKERHFTEVFCQVIENNIDKSFDLILGQMLERQVIQTILTTHSDIYLTPRSRHDEEKYEVPVLIDDTPKNLDFKKHWNTYWRKANVEAAKMVEKMLKNNEQGLVVVTNDAIASQNTTNPTTKIWKKKQFREYWMYAIKTKLVVLNDVNIDGNVYAINCEIQCQANVNITTQLFVTKNTIFDQRLRQFISISQWNTNTNHDLPLQLQELEDKAEQCSEKKLFDDALVHLQKYLQICIDAFGCNHPYVSIAYNMIANAYSDSAQYATAIATYEKAVQIIADNFGTKHAFVAQFYHNLALIFHDKRQYQKAIEYNEKSLDLRLKIFENNHVDIAWSYHNLGIIYDDEGEHNKALDCHEKALAIRLALFGNNHADVAFSYHNLGIIHDNIGEHDEAIEYYEKALQIRLSMFGTNHIDVGWSYNNLGLAYHDKGQFDKAIEFCEKALNVRLNLFGTNHADVALSYHNLGIVYNDEGQHDKAIECYEKSLKIRLDIFGPKHVDIGYSYNNLGIAYHDKGQYDKAIEYHEKALQIRKEIFLGATQDISDSNWNLGLSFERKGDTETAQKYYEEAWKIANVVLGEWHDETIEAKEKIRN